jgi:hypothetical protein
MTTTTFSLEDLYAAAEHAIANFSGEEEIDQDTIELVAGLAKQAVDEATAGNYSYARDLVEKASTYVLTDLDDLQMNDWICEVDNQLEEYGIGSFL